MKQYLDLIEDVMTNGLASDDRTGTGTRKLFGKTMKFDLQEGFPLLTTKKIHFKSVVHELLWFLKGDTNIEYLNDNGVRIWDEWATDTGNLGPIYGKQWRDWDDVNGKSLVGRLTKLSDKSCEPELTVAELRAELAQIVANINTTKGVDQITDLIRTLNTQPNSRRMVVSAWNPTVLPYSVISPRDNARLGKAALPACHTMFQVGTTELTPEEVTNHLSKAFNQPVPPGAKESLLKDAGRLGLEVPTHKLNMMVFLRSQDLMLGTPFNIASYALLTHMLASVTGMIVGELTWVAGDVHIYNDHTDAAELQLLREPTKLPTLQLAKLDCIYDYTYDDVLLEDYQPQPGIKLKVSV